MDNPFDEIHPGTKTSDDGRTLLGFTLGSWLAGCATLLRIVLITILISLIWAIIIEVRQVNRHLETIIEMQQ